MKNLGTMLIAVLVFCAAFAGTHVEAVTFDINFNDPANFGFYDPTYGSDARAALTFAADTWGGVLADSYAGETVSIDATFDNTVAGTSALASTELLGYHYDPGLPHGGAAYFVFPISVANHLAGTDLNGATSEISIKFNPDVVTMAGSLPWYFGTDGSTPAGSLDFASNALHEIMHGLGMISGMNGDGSLLFTVTNGNTFDTGYIYDTFVYDDASGAFPIGMSAADRANALTSGDLLFVGNAATDANGGVNPELYSPATFRDGSSVVHLDPIVFAGTDELMRPNLGVGSAFHNPSAIDLGILEGVGWNIVSSPEPSTLILIGSGLAGLGFFRKKCKNK